MGGARSRLAAVLCAVGACTHYQGAEEQQHASRSAKGAPAQQDDGGKVISNETFDGNGTSWDLTRGTLTVVDENGERMGRLCADQGGRGELKKDVQPVDSGTYVLSARVRVDPSAPATKWTLSSLSWVPEPLSQENEGQLGSTFETVSTTQVVQSGAFQSTFAVQLGIAAGTCMLVDDIRVVHKP